MAIRRLNSEPEKTELVPLLPKYLKKNPHLKSHPFIITGIKETSNGEWVLISHYKVCCVLLSTASQQYEDVMEMLEEAHHKGHAAYFEYTTKTKSNAEFLTDDEVLCECRTSEDGMIWRLKRALDHIPYPSPDPSGSGAPTPPSAPPERRAKKRPPKGA